VPAPIPRAFFKPSSRYDPAPRIHGAPRGPIVVALANPGSVRPALASHGKPAQRDPQASQTLAITA
jgi:hypothetical protein